MDQATLTTAAAEADSGHQSANETAVRFLNTLFDPDDDILLRPIETWTENGHRRSRVDFHNVTYQSHRQALPISLLLLLRLAERERVNLFFGVCPRVGSSGKYDLAWQIRTVRALWADIDHVSVEEAQERAARASLPAPSIVVNSGNGAHLYWLLDEPYSIDDAGEPPAVETEWLQTPEGKKKPRKYVIEDGDKVYLDQRRHLSRLSTKAQYIQNVLAGIARQIGGDHTTDLSRLLRIPGSFNRKDQRNGAEPRPTELVVCDATRRYPLSLFESLAVATPESERHQKIALMPLPKARKPSASKEDKLAELIAASAIAKPGHRSEADFAVCCYALKNGVDREHVWREVESIGKFGEQGRRYFDTTWANAEYEVRAIRLLKLEKNTARLSTCGDENNPVFSQESNHGTACGAGTIHVDPATTPVSETMQQITDCLLAAGDVFRRADQPVQIRSNYITPILEAAELAGILNHRAEFYFLSESGGEYKPLPASYGNTWLCHPGEQQRLPVIRLFTRNPVFTDDWRLVTPGYDQTAGIYYTGPQIGGRTGTTHLDNLLCDFCFRTRGDRTNYIAMLLTMLLISRFIGSKPMLLLNGNQPGLGKTILAQIQAILRDGHPVETASYNPNDEEFEKRLGAIVRRGVTTLIIDNAKGRRRDPRIESPCLERAITDPVLSFRMLGFSKDIRAENSHLFCLTANSPDVSRDLVSRSVVVNLHFEGDPARRSFSLRDPEGYAQKYRNELLGELIGMVEHWKGAGMPMAGVHSRFNKLGWGTMIGGILTSCGLHDFLANAEEAALQLDDTRREFSELVTLLAEQPQSVRTAAELVELCEINSLLVESLGSGSSRSRATRFGLMVGRFLAERFPLPDGRTACFQRSEDRNGYVYRVEVV